MTSKLGTFFVTLLLCSQLDGKLSPVARSSTSLAREDQDNQLLLLSTLDGSLYAVDRHTGITQWQLKDEPAVKVPVDASKAVSPLFLPDPKDGSLYVYGGSEALKKLPFTIPQLVAQSPCRSSDGILYTGKKMDTWFTVDPKTGVKQPVLSSDGDHVCPLSESDQTNSLFIGRTEYNIIMLDSKKKERKWNVTFFDYSSNTMDSDLLSNYEMVHFMGSSSGRVITMDRRTHTHLWSGKYESPVIGVYILDSEGLISCPFTSVAEETLDALVVQLQSTAKSTWLDADQLKLKSTLYVGEHPHGLYALPSLVDQSVVTVKHINSPLLLEGPEEVSVSDSDDNSYRGPPVKGENPSSHGLNNLLPSTNAIDVAPSYPYAIILGHYQAPSYSDAILADSQKTNALIPLTKPILSFDWELDNETDDNGSSNKDNVGSNSKPNSRSSSNSSCWDEVVAGNFTSLLSSDCIQYAYSGLRMWVSQQENKSLKVAMALIIISMAALFCYVRGKMREIQSLSQGSRIGRVLESDSGLIPQPAEFIGGGTRVGKITFFTNEVLGKGCEGTFVYRGLFDGRNVAVKRLLPECFSLADREVALLRESDQHANVVRYFCTEQDHLFRYIALELAAATVADLVEGRISSTNGIPLTRLTTTDILRQAMLGLSHLHSLDIVHRDIKPQNVLLSVPNAHGEVRAMISDFGLCKKLQKGRMSFSRRSGIAGTDGWIAPEMLSGSGRTTCAVDIFSMGCVFYYVKTSGKHPFGDPLRRQANILSGDCRLNDLVGSQVDQLLTGSLVKSMLSWEPLERPPAEAILAHPLFWSKAKIMSFFQDVSDRVEKDDASTSSPLQALETDGARVVRGDWRVHICDEVAQDLRRYRNYRGLSVRDLLRALRNKKHHYRELSLEAQKSLGTIPDQFVMYWMDRFPRLLLHSWLSMQIVRHEPVFRPYYHILHTFSKSEIVIEADKDCETIVPPEGGNLNSVSWQVLKDKSSPKNKRKSLGANKKLGSKESPKRDTYPINHSNDDDGYVWRKRNVTNDKKMSPKQRTENWRNPNSFLSSSEKSSETTDHQTNDLN